MTVLNWYFAAPTEAFEIILKNTNSIQTFCKKSQTEHI